MTKRENFEAIVEVLKTDEVGNAGLIEAVEKEIALLDKRAGANRKPTKTQVENEAIKVAIVAALTAEGETASDIAKAQDISVQKATQLLKQLREDGMLQRVEGKGKTKTVFAAV